MPPPVLEPVSALTASAANPRETDPARLALVALSLRKLGFLLPVYVGTDGVLLSGHQRTLAAKSLGWTEVPVVRVRVPELQNDRLALLLAMNRGTNDLEAVSAPREMLAQLTSSGLAADAEKLPDAPDRFPCMRTQRVPLAALLDANASVMKHYAARLTSDLAVYYGVRMPVVTDPSLRVVNGIGRLVLAAQLGEAAVDVVKVSPAAARFAAGFLNLLSMDFKVTGANADVLRINSTTTKPLGRHKVLPRCFLFDLIGDVPARTFDLAHARERLRWTKHYGRRVLDFGSGVGASVTMLRQHGIAADGWEPWPMSGRFDAFDLARARAETDVFLGLVGAPVQWDSVFCSAVYNVLPFAEDREHVTAVLAALCGSGTVYATGVGVDQSGADFAAGRAFRNARDAHRDQFYFGTEPDVVLSDTARRPKLQRYWTAEALEAQFRPHFRTVRASYGVHNAQVVARHPIVDPARLAAALRFEFDLPYPEGSRLGCADAALAAFSKRLGLKLGEA